MVIHLSPPDSRSLGASDVIDIRCPDLIGPIDSGKPWQNGMAKSFNGKFRDECLSMEWFRNRVEAKAVIEQWRQHYNEVRPHSSLANKKPAASKKQCFSTTKPEAVFQECVVRTNQAGQALRSALPPPAFADRHSLNHTSAPALYSHS